MFNSILFVLIYNYVPKKQKVFILFCTLISSTYFLIGYEYKFCFELNYYISEQLLFIH